MDCLSLHLLKCHIVGKSHVMAHLSFSSIYDRMKFGYFKTSMSCESTLFIDQYLASVKSYKVVNQTLFYNENII